MARPVCGVDDCKKLAVVGTPKGSWCTEHNPHEVNTTVDPSAVEVEQTAEQVEPISE